jgi:tetratricopeptide (TPR) repeat protein
LALKHNTFGGFCLQAGDLEKANSHFIKAKEIICDKYKIPFSNYEINMGNLEGQKKNYKSSAEHYENAIEISPYNTKNKIKLP